METTFEGGLVRPNAQTNTSDSPNKEKIFPKFESLTRPTLTTEDAAYYLNRKPQTLRGWACYENGPIRPTRINGRLAWSVASLRNLVGGAA